MGTDIVGESERFNVDGRSQFSISRYFKGTSDRGFILGSVDEVIQTLDDNAMTLQSMSAGGAE